MSSRRRSHSRYPYRRGATWSYTTATHYTIKPDYETDLEADGRDHTRTARPKARKAARTSEADLRAERAYDTPRPHRYHSSENNVRARASNSRYYERPSTQDYSYSTERQGRYRDHGRSERSRSRKPEYEYEYPPRDRTRKPSHSQRHYYTPRSSQKWYDYEGSSNSGDSNSSDSSDSYGSDSYGSDSYGSDSNGSDSYGSDSYGSDSYGSNSSDRYNSRSSKYKPRSSDRSSREHTYAYDHYPYDGSTSKPRRRQYTYYSDNDSWDGYTSKPRRSQSDYYSSYSYGNDPDYKTGGRRGNADSHQSHKYETRNSRRYEENPRSDAYDDYTSKPRRSQSDYYSSHSTRNESGYKSRDKSDHADSNRRGRYESDSRYEKSRSKPKTTSGAENKGEDVEIPNHYATLGISSRASTAEIKKAAKLKRVEVHPDKCMKSGMSEREKAKINTKATQVGEAADVLTNPTLKAKYDREWAAVYG